MTEESTFDRTIREGAQMARRPHRRPLDGTEGDYAKANAARTRAICSFRRSERVVACEGTVAFLHGVFVGDDVAWALLLSDAFVQGDDAVWRYSDFATDRARRGGSPHQRHGPRGWTGVVPWAKTVPPLPAVVECHECRQLRVLAADRLEVIGNPS